MKGIKSKVHYYIMLSIAISKGTLYIIYYKIFNRKIKIGFPFVVFHKFHISGDGFVNIGKRCVVLKNVHRGLNISTLSENAVVTIGNRCLLSGLTIRCQNQVVIGDEALTAISVIQDLPIINNTKIYQSSDVNKKIISTDPVLIGHNVWLGGQSCILSGVTIGNDSVISAGALCYKQNINEYSVGSGNPVRRALSIKKLLSLQSRNKNH